VARGRGPGWVPEQHGAWAMLAAPLLVGAVGGGPSWLHLLLALAWLVAYLAFQATALWLKARRRPRWWPPVRAYGALLVLLGVPLVVLDPLILWWGVPFAPLLAVGLWSSWARRDRSLLNDGATTLAACLMCVVAWQLGGRPFAAPGEAWASAAVLWVYFFGTAFYVKTMIRERGNPVMLRVSIGYHALATLALLAISTVRSFLAIDPEQGAERSGTFLLATLGLYPGTWSALAVVFALLTARAWLVPARFPRASPKQLGIGEILATSALVAVLLLAPA